MARCPRFSAIVGQTKLDESKVFWTKAGAAGNPGEHPWTDFFGVVKGVDEIRVAFPRKCAVRTGLPLEAPANSQESGQDEARASKARRSRGLEGNAQ
jgi:hypothetical protein